MVYIIIIQEFNNIFACSVDGILQDLSDTSIYLLLGLCFDFQIISLRKWYDIRAKNKALFENKQCLQTNNEQLTDKINTNENQKIAEKIKA